jgi:N utilization substance protein B
MTPDELLPLAFDTIYVLPGAERPDKPAPDPKILKSLPTEQRDRVYRTALRRLAFQLMYQIDAAVTQPEPAALDTFVKHTLAEVEGLGPMALEDVRTLVTGAHNGRKDADAEFLALAPEWPTNRLAAVDRALLRLAHYEMTSGRTPPKIVVNEAVELAKHYSTDKSPAFINGLLDKVLKRLEPTAQPVEAQQPPAQ